MTETTTPGTSHYWEHPTLFAWLFILASTLTMFSLGVWQLQRLAWKEALIAEIATAAKDAPVTIWPKDEAAQRALRFKRVELQGTFLHAHEFHLAARYHRSTLGYHILTPFQLGDGRVVVVNRGWVPTTRKQPELRAGGQIKGPQAIVVMVRADKDRTYFTPENDPVGNMWFWRDVDAMATHTGLTIEPITVDQLYYSAEDHGPIATDGKIELRNDHLGYAITWFMIGLSGIIIFIIYHRKQISSQD